MRWSSFGVVLALSTAAVVAAAQSSASAAPRALALEAGARGRVTIDLRDHLRPVDSRRGPFFGLRVQSMDVAGEAKRVGCFEYVCHGIEVGAGEEKYELVRTRFDVRVAQGECDEAMKLPLPGDADLRGFRGKLGQTRWMRKAGPAGTPVGGFVGRLQIDALLGDAERRLPVFDFALTGTTGLRPMRGDAEDATALDEGRCKAPRRDEGWYVGRIQRRALLAYALEHGEEEGVIAMLRRLDKALLAGTFEGRLGFDVSTTDAVDYCDVAKGAWWFDGLLAWRCVRSEVVATPDRDPPVDAAVDVDARIEVR